MYRIVAALLVALVAMPLHADYNAGLAEYKNKNFAAALKQFKAAAKGGSAKATYRVGQMYYRGEGAVQDYTVALKYIQVAAELNVVEAQYLLAYMHENKQGVRRSNPTTAFTLYKKAAANGNEKAQFRLATLYAEGIVVPQDLPKAFENYMHAARRGNPKAQYEIARLYDIGLSESVCQRSQSITRCIRGLSRNKKTGKSDDQEAASWYQKSADQGYAPAQYRLGELYDTGKGIAKNTEKARKWYAMAADQGMVEARFKLNRHKKSVVDGQEREVADERTRSADMRAARDGDMHAQLRVAKMFDKGLGVTKDYVRAYAWYNIAAAQGSASARASRDAIEAVLNPQQISKGQQLARALSREIAGQ